MFMLLSKSAKDSRLTQSPLTVCEIVIESATNRREACHEQEKEYQLDRAHKKTGWSLSRTPRTRFPSAK